MRKTLFLIGLSAVIALQAATNLKVNKPDASSQQYDITNINNLTFTDPGTAKLKIKKPDGSQQFFSLSEIANLSFSGTAIEKEEFFRKLGIGLVSNYPNPFNPTTTVNFSTTSTGLVKVEVFNQIGQLVSNLHNGNPTAGKHAIQWNAQNASAGTYFIRVSQNGETLSSKMLLSK